MTETSLSLVSIVVGILAAIGTKKLLNNHSLSLTASAIAGVFGSIFLIKIVGRLGVHPSAIVDESGVEILLLMIYLLVSAVGGITAVLVSRKLKERFL